MTVDPASCLVIPDIHQDFRWVRQVLDREHGCGRVVFLGDYFDTTRRQGLRPLPLPDACRALLHLREELGSRATFLLGNHDIQYLEAARTVAAGRPPLPGAYSCSDYTMGIGEMIALALPLEFWEEARLFAVAHGHLLSHAGLAAEFWPAGATLDDSLAELDRECREALGNVGRGRHRLLDAGYARGGDAEIGGMTWQDWELEFSDDLPLPQIVGHTRGRTARQTGRSWCLDAGQTTYGVLTPAGLSVRGERP